jgi:hypothetical protein
MGLLINATDFIDTFALSKQIVDNISAYIDRYEEKYLADLLGAELYKLFKADVLANTPNQVPTDANYLLIYNSILEDYGSCVVRSEGMKSMILGFIWFEYVRGSKHKHTESGVVYNNVELSTIPAWSSGFIQKRYNESITNYENIQWYICQNSGDYPEYNGIGKGLILF